MRVFIAATMTLLVSAAIFATLGAGQVQPKPGPGTGIVMVEGLVTVTGDVNVANTPAVRALQNGDWTVGVSSLPPVRLSAPGFLKVGQAYRFTWPGGRQDEITVREVADAWIRGDRRENGVRVSGWVNAAMAAMIEPK